MGSRINGHSFTRKFGRMDPFRRLSPTKMGCTFQWSSSGEVSVRAGCGSRVPTSGQVTGQFNRRFGVLQSCPAHLRGRWRQSVRVALEARHHGISTGDGTRELQGWKLFCLLPFWLLRRPRSKGHVGEAELTKRFDLFGEASRRNSTEAIEDVLIQRQQHVPMSDEQKARVAERRVRCGEVSRALQCLSGAALAPGNEATFQEMQRRRPQAPVQPFPQEVLDFGPEVPIQLDQHIFLESLKSARRGTSAGPGGWTYEHLKVLLDNTDTRQGFQERSHRH